MGDMGDYFNDRKNHRARMRSVYGINCPRCAIGRPKTQPSILLPGQRCKVDGYQDPRTEEHTGGSDHKVGADV